MVSAMTRSMIRPASRALAVLTLSGGMLLADGASAQFSFGGLRNSLIDFALKQISVEGVFEIRAAGIEQPEDGVTELVGVEIADKDGVWLRAEAFSLRWRARALLSGELDITQLGARGLRVERLPNLPQVEVKEDAEIAQGPSRGLLDWPRAPITVHVRALTLDDAFLAAGVASPDQSIAFDAAGSLQDAGDLQAAELKLTRTDDVRGDIALSYARDFAAQTLKLDLTADEAAGGLAAAMMSLPEGSASRVALHADGPIDDWGLTLTAEAERMLTVNATGKLFAAGPLDASLNVELISGEALPADLRAALGDRATLALAAAEDETGAIRVREGRVRAPAITLDASGVYQKADGTLDFDIDLEATGAAVQPIEGVELGRFGFDGALKGATDDFTATGALRLEGLSTAPLDIGTAALDADVALAGAVITAKLSGDAEGVRVDRLGPDLMGRTNLNIDAVWDGGAQRADLTAFDIVSPLLSLKAAGTADVGGGAADLRWTLATPELAPVAAAYGQDAEGRLQAEGAAQGAFDDMRISGNAAATGLRFGPHQLGEVTLRHDLKVGNEIGGEIDLTARRGRFGDADVAAEFALDGPTLLLPRLHAEALGAVIDGALEVETAVSLIEGDITLDAPRLTDLRPVFDALELGAPPEGAIAGEIALRKRSGRQDAALNLTGRGLGAMGYAADLVKIDVDAADLLSNATSAKGVITAEGATGPDGLALAALRVEGEGRNLKASPDADVTLRAEGVAGPGGAGLETLSMEATARDVLGAGLVDATLQAAGLAGPGVTARDLTAELSAREVTKDPAATLKAALEGIAAGGASVGGLTLDADLSGLASAPRGTVATEATGVNAGGASLRRATLSADLTDGGEGRTDVTARLDAPGLSASGAELGAVKVRATARDALGGAPVLELRADAAGGTAADLTLRPLAFTVDGPLSALKIALDAAAELPDGREAKAALRASADVSGDPKVTVSTLSVDTPEGEGRNAKPGWRVALTRPLQIAVEGARTRLSNLGLSFPGGGIEGNVALAQGASGRINAQIDDLAPLSELLTLPTESGALTLEADFDTGAGRAEAALRGTGLRIEDMDPETEPLRLDADLDWRRGKAALEAVLVGGFGQPMRMTAALPLRGGGLTPSVPSNAQIDASLNWQGRIAPLWGFVPLADHLLDGEALIDLKLRGPLSAPQPAGVLQISDGRYENLETGTILDHLTVDAGLADDGGMQVALRATDGAEAPVALDATIAGGVLDAAISASEAVLVRRDDAAAAVSIDVTAKGPLAGPHVAGDVTIDRAEIRLVNATPPSVADLGEIRWKGDPPPEEADEKTEAGPTLDLRIHAPDDIFVRGRGLVSEWQADLKVTGYASAPRIVGAVEKRRGELRLLSRPFILERGRITFDGGAQIDPSIDVALELERDDVIGRIAVRGRASDPEIALESSPPLPEDEILPRILFGQSRQSLTAAQAAELASAAASLAGGGEGALGSLREAAGLDVLSLGNSASGGTAIEAGTNVAEGVYVGAKQPVDGSKTEFEVKIEVLDNVEIEGVTGGDAVPSLGVQWKMDF